MVCSRLMRLKLPISRDAILVHTWTNCQVVDIEASRGLRKTQEASRLCLRGLLGAEAAHNLPWLRKALQCKSACRFGDSLERSEWARLGSLTKVAASDGCADPKEGSADHLTGLVVGTTQLVSGGAMEKGGKRD